jgi:hypothetical protein
LPFPFPGEPPVERFVLDGEAFSTFQYYNREQFTSVYDDIKALHLRKGYRRYSIRGTIGYGKSHIVAALACLLIREGLKVVFLPDCRGLVESFTTYFRSALLLTFVKEPALQQKILRCRTTQELIAFCMSFAGPFYIIFDQMNVLDINTDMPDPSATEKQACKATIKMLANRHFLIYCSSGNYQHMIQDNIKQTGVMQKHLFGGFSEVSLSEEVLN